MDNGLFSNVIRHALILRMVCHYGIRSHSTKKAVLDDVPTLQIRPTSTKALRCGIVFFGLIHALLLTEDQIILTYFVRGNITVPLVDILFDWMGRN